MSLSSIAEAFNMNATYLSNFFKGNVGENFSSYVSKLRMEEAKMLLSDGTESIQDIAQKVGYTNSNAFIRNFKKLEGITPGEYRINLR